MLLVNIHASQMPHHASRMITMYANATRTRPAAGTVSIPEARLGRGAKKVWGEQTGVEYFSSQEHEVRRLAERPSRSVGDAY
jgi:hypothetical protein